MSDIRARTEPDWEHWAAQWPLRPGMVYLNHGSFGPSPQPVLAARQHWIEQLESEPLDFLVRRLDPLLADTRRKLAQFIGASADDLIFVENSTVGMNIVAASLKLRAGDEVLLNDHEYGAVLRIWQRACDRSGAKLRVAALPTPIESADEIVDRLMAEVTDRTRLIVVSHITSPTAIIFPIAKICRAARTRGLRVCVDGPHAPAMVPIDLNGLDCDYYTASCHKWLSAPFGSGFLHVHPRVQAEMEPIVMSWGRAPAGESPSWRDEFQWSGTRDSSAQLAISAAIDFLNEIGLDAFRRRTHDLARQARQRIGELTGLEPLTPDSSAWYGSMAAVPLPDGDAQPLQDALWEQFRIEVPIIDWNGRRLIRVSSHAYNSSSQLDYLLEALRKLRVVA